MQSTRETTSEKMKRLEDEIKDLKKENEGLKLEIKGLRLSLVNALKIKGDGAK